MSISESARQRFNAWGRERRPFVFVIPYDEALPCVLEALDEPGDVFYALPSAQRLPEGNPLPEPVLWEPEFLPRPLYERAFEKVQYHLRRGDSYLTNLCMATPLRSNLSLEQIFLRARAPYRVLVRGLFTCFSPELFVRMEGNAVTTCPMKGTSPADGDAGPEALLADEKERREHATVTDLLRNDLAMVGQGVQVRRYRYAERIVTQQGDLWATSSEVEARLPDDWRDRLGDLLGALLPAGSVTGAPKARTCRVIAEAEPQPRGYYTGIFGIFDGRALESAVSIRFVEQVGEGRFLYRSGGGITTLSDVREEYDELCRKVYLPFDPAEEGAEARRGGADAF